MTKAAFVANMQEQWDRFVQECSDGFLRSRPWEAGGDFWRFLDGDGDGEYAMPDGVVVFVDFEEYMFYISLDDGVLTSPFCLGKEMETEWVPPMHEGIWVEAHIEQLTRLCDRQLKLTQQATYLLRRFVFGPEETA